MPKSRPKPEADTAADVPGARARAMQLLARREHSTWELRRKLAERGFAHAVVDAVVAALAAEGLQSDARFAEQYVRNRAERGFGPARIAAELRERGVDEAMGAAQLGSWDWPARAERARRKRFGAAVPGAWAERARQARFLQTRGFGREHMAVLFGAEPLD